jgi:hypothetical protein
MRSCLNVLLLACLTAATPVHAQEAAPLTLEQVMADPDWIGPPVERMWWSWDGGTAYYLAKRGGSNVRDTYAQPVTGSVANANALNPFVLPAGQTLTARNRFLSFPRIYANESTAYHLVGGIKGKLPGSWSYEASANINKPTHNFKKKGSGIWWDIVYRKRASETRAFAGKLIEYGKQAGADTRLNEKLTSMIYEIEDGKRELGFHNFDELAAYAAEIGKTLP